MISAVYKIVNTVTGDFYIGSSRNVMKRWTQHKCPSVWVEHPNSQLYKAFQKYGVDKFRFQILAPVEPEYLTQVEQEFIDLLQPTYNNYRAKGRDFERIRETKRRYFKEYRKSDKYKDYQMEYNKEYHKEYQKSDKYKDYQREYQKSDKGKEFIRKRLKKYRNQLCLYNGEEITLGTLIARFRRAGFEHPTLEARKYLSTNNN